MKLVTKAWTEQFYYKPRVTFQDLFDHQEGLIVLSGCLSSPVMQILKEEYSDASGKDSIMFRAESQLDLFKEK
jgi:DNA polymerase III, alpha subunit